MSIAKKENIKSTNGEIYFFQKNLQSFNNVRVYGKADLFQNCYVSVRFDKHLIVERLSKLDQSITSLGVIIQPCYCSICFIVTNTYLAKLLIMLTEFKDIKTRTVMLVYVLINI